MEIYFVILNHLVCCTIRHTFFLSIIRYNKPTNSGQINELNCYRYSIMTWRMVMKYTKIHEEICDYRTANKLSIAMQSNKSEIKLFEFEK